MEMHNTPNKRIGRPRQIYTGVPEREYLPVEKRP
jgi:citrate synthase